MTNEPPLTILPDTKGWQRIVANQRQALYEKEQELERLRVELNAAADALDFAARVQHPDGRLPCLTCCAAADAARKATERMDKEAK